MEGHEISVLVELLRQMGELLLSSGAEISRVEETLKRVFHYYTNKKLELFVITNGLFLCFPTVESGAYVHIRHIPSIQVNLSRVAEVNELSRQIEQGHYGLEEAVDQFERIKTGHILSFKWIAAASSVGSGCFCYLFGGTISDCICSFLVGFLLIIFQQFIIKKELPQVIIHLFCSMIAAGLASILYRYGFGSNLDMIIIGSIIPLIPGVAFVNGVRDIADGDYLSGGIRLTDTILKIICIALGVGIGLKI